MRRRLLVVLVALVLLIGGGISAYWYVVARRVAAGTAAWLAAREANGWTVSSSGRHLGGWPRAGAVVFEKFRFAGGEPDIPGGVAWKADRLVVAVELFHPDHVDVLAHGEQQIGPRRGSASKFDAQLTRLRIPLHSAKPMGVLTLRALRAGTDGLSIGAARMLMIADRAAGKGEAALDVAMDAREVALPSGVNWPLGRHVARLTADATIGGPIPPPRGLVADARAWRDDGGVIALRHVDLRWGPLRAELSGRASLDQDLQLLASGTARAGNYAETLNTLAARRIIPSDAAVAAKAVLSLLASSPSEGPAQVELPFTVQDRVLAIRGIPLLKLPALRWPSS